MNINTITAEDLRRMPDKEGLILQGCGGDLTEWVDGINEMLTNAGILKDGSQFENVFAFQHGELTCLLYKNVQHSLDWIKHSRSKPGVIQTVKCTLRKVKMVN